MSRYSTAVGAFTIALALVLASCGDDSDPDAATDSPAEPAEASDDPAEDPTGADDDPAAEPAATSDDPAEASDDQAAEPAEASDDPASASDAPAFPGLEIPEGDAILSEVALGGVTLSTGETFPFEATELDLEAPSVVGSFNGDQVVIVPLNMESGSGAGEVLFASNATEAPPTPATDVKVSPVEFDGLPGTAGVNATGTIDRDGEAVVFALSIPVGMGSSIFELDDNRAAITGDLGTRTNQKISYLTENHPEVDTLVLENITGSVNDEINVQTGRLIRAAGYTTMVPAEGKIFSGGVDLFTSGAERVAEEGSEIGVHSWCCGPNGDTADKLSQDDPAHNDQLAYFSEMLGADVGRAFYFFTLQASPFDSTDNMTAAERDYFNIVTANDTLAAERDFSAEIAKIVGDSSFETPSAVAEAVVAGLSTGGATAEPILLLDGDPTKVVVTVSGEADDSVSGEVVAMTLEPNEATGWAVTGATTDPVCARGVSGNQCA